MTPAMLGEQLANAITGLIRGAVRRRDARDAVGPGGPWEAMLRQETGPNRSDPIAPVRRVQSGRKD